MWDLALTGAGVIPITIRGGGMGHVVIHMFRPMHMVGMDLITIGIPIIIHLPIIIPEKNTQRDHLTADNQPHRDQLQRETEGDQIQRKKAAAVVPTESDVQVAKLPPRPELELPEIMAVE
jgi:hypothetical protein